MTTSLAHLEPALVWKHFAELLAIPRPSRHEERVVAHLKKWAAARKFEAVQDKVGNVIVRVPASKGHEKAPTIILQGHMDMVAEKDSSTVFDFEKDPIEVKIDGDWLIAEKTTMGADNGIGVAAAMAVADDPAGVHGPLELLVTVDEEAALTGASALDGSLLKGRTLINLDSEEDWILFVGCAGGCTTEMTFPLRRAPAPAGFAAVRVEVKGLKGGHSGLTIHENRGDALKILARVLGKWGATHPVLLAAIEGGNKHNAIPREASAVVQIPSAFLPEARTLAAAVQKDTLSEIAGIDPGLEIHVHTAIADAAAPADAESTRRVVQALLALPHGVLVMSRDVVGSPETSTNLAIAQMEGDAVKVISSTRSSIGQALRHGLDQTNAVVTLAGGTVKEMSAYPGWKPEMSSKLLAICKGAYKDLNGKEPIVTVIHAGLECGIIGERMGGGVEMISFGPHMQGVHAPGERLEIPSVGRFWKFLAAVLAKLT